MIKKEENKTLYVTLPKNIVTALDDIVSESRKKGKTSSKSKIILIALLTFFDICKHAKDKKVNQKEEC